MTPSDAPAHRRRTGLATAQGAAGAACVLAIAAALTGCGSDSKDDAGAPGSATPSHSTKPSPASPTPTSPSSSPSPTAAKPVKPMKPSTPAELQACTDGSCTIVVTQGTEIPRADALRAGPFTVDSVSAEGVDLYSVAPDGFVASFRNQLPGPGASTINDQSLSVLTITGNTAKLRLFPAK
ncbi:hypothetical protein AAHZ94_18595 [Streptomyces sp. HSW2009]|uniref:hypothetical protein n=1 Tax=Streptomyces sp. HSW2009 TaxID=3142890 RepID=UPI0032EB6B63